MRHACDRLSELNVPFDVQVVSAHRTPDLLFSYAQTARERGLRAIIAGAGGAAHLPGMLAAKTPVPVLGVPVQYRALNGLDSRPEEHTSALQSLMRGSYSVLSL